MKTLLTAICVSVALMFGSALHSGELETRVVPRQTRVILKDGKEIVGTVLISGPRGIVLVVDEAEEFVPKASVKETLPVEAPKQPAVETPGKTEQPEGTVCTTENASMLQTYQISRVCGQYIVGAKTSGGAEAPDDGSDLMPDLSDATGLPLPEDPGPSAGKTDNKKFGILKPQKKKKQKKKKKREQDFGIIPERSDKKPGTGKNNQNNNKTGLEDMNLPGILQDMIKGNEGTEGIEGMLDDIRGMVR